MDPVNVLVASDMQDDELSASAIVKTLERFQAVSINIPRGSNPKGDLVEKLKGKSKAVVIVIRNNIEDANIEDANIEDANIEDANIEDINIDDLTRCLKTIQGSGPEEDHLKAAMLIYFHIGEFKKQSVLSNPEDFSRNYPKMQCFYMADEREKIKSFFQKFNEQIIERWRTECISKILDGLKTDDQIERMKNDDYKLKVRIESQGVLKEGPILCPLIPAEEERLLTLEPLAIKLDDAKLKKMKCAASAVQIYQHEISDTSKPLVYIINNVQVDIRPNAPNPNTDPNAPNPNPNPNVPSAHNSVIDRENLTRLFRAMKFEVLVYEGLSKTELERVAKKFADTDKRPFYIFILMTDINSRGCIKFPHDTNDDSMKYRELLKLMYSKNCKIKDKPRFVVLHSWVSRKDWKKSGKRGGHTRANCFRSPYREPNHDQRGLIVVYSVTWREESSREANNGNGTRFILALCKTISTKVSTTDLTSMVIPINKLVTDGGLEEEHKRTRQLKDLPCPVWTLQNDELLFLVSTTGERREAWPSPTEKGENANKAGGNKPDGQRARPTLNSGKKPEAKYRALIVGQRPQFTSGENLMKATQEFAAVLASRWFEVTHVFTDDNEIPDGLIEKNILTIVLVICRDEQANCDNSHLMIQIDTGSTPKDGEVGNKSKVHITGNEDELCQYLQNVTVKLNQECDYIKCFEGISVRNDAGNFMLPTPCFTLITSTNEQDTFSVAYAFEREVRPIASSLRQNVNGNQDPEPDPKPLKSRGLALVIGNCAFEDDEYLPDVLFDCTNYVNSLSLMGYSVTVKLNLEKAAEFEKAITDFAKNEKHKECCVLVVLSHGDLYSIGLPSGGFVKESSILEWICNGEKTKDIHKFVVFDCCRNEPENNEAVPLQTINELQHLQNSSKLIVCYGTSPGDISGCDPNKGGYFSIALCCVLYNLYNKYNQVQDGGGLTSLIIQVNNFMMSRYGPQDNADETKFYQLSCWMVQSNEEIYLISNEAVGNTNQIEEITEQVADMLDKRKIPKK